jgi:hypothetical protein
MTLIKDSPMPAIATSREQKYARIPVDVSQTSFFEGREFRFVRKIATPVVYRFTAPIEFILSSQTFGIVDGEFEFYAWRDDNVTPSGTWTSEPIFAKNTSATGQRVSVLDQTTQGRYLAAGTYYLEFTGISDASYKLEWEERP